MRAHSVVARGQVQGVGYRAFAASEAAVLGITGYVRNREQPDEVEVLACGSDKSIETFLERLREGPPGARVNYLTSQPVESTLEYQDFSIRY